MISDIVIDTKGRILIPKDIREQMGLLPGMKLLIKKENDNLLILRPTSNAEFKKEVQLFREKLKELKIEPISFEKLF